MVCNEHKLIRAWSSKIWTNKGMVCKEHELIRTWSLKNMNIAEHRLRNMNQ